MTETIPKERRDFLYFATAGTGAVAVGAAIWPLIDQMNPSADVVALSTIRVDISSLEEGSQLTVKWRANQYLFDIEPQKKSKPQKQISLKICPTRFQEIRI